MKLAHSPHKGKGEAVARATLAEEIHEICGENVYLCYQCQKCASGCPVADYFDLSPNQLMRAIQLDERESALSSKTIWLCAACETCATRCPQDIDITRVMDVLKIMAREQGITPGVPSVPIFYSAALHNLRIFGRLYEAGLMGELYMRMLLNRQLDFGQIFSKDLPVGIKMFREGRLKILPHLVRRKQGPREKKVRSTQRRVAYFPGCSLSGTSVEYGLSFKAVAEKLGLIADEPEGWTCCGTTPAHSTDHYLSTLLPMKNLALMEEMGHSSVTAPCPSCYLRMRKALHDISKDAELRKRVKGQIGYQPSKGLHVEHGLNTFTDRVGLEAIGSEVSRSLGGLKVACYYGCVITRPPKVTGFGEYEYPTNMDRLMKKLGATPLDWSYKTRCCGASLGFTNLEIVLELGRKILANAKAVGAEAIVVACPLCQVNLDSRQAQMSGQSNLPVLYFTQLMGLAFGLEPMGLGLDKHFIDPMPLLREKKIIPSS
ncbi:MAG: 4Fe-4S dicluster domain-containing protein [Deltaproteobacteria bacterium]|nr:4Fe-4S dicluster domain-containing protein [Deltaproteobacteria bacterium]